MKQLLPTPHGHSAATAGFQMRSVAMARGALGSEMTTSGGDVNSAAVVQTFDAYPVDTTSPVGARTTCTMRSRLRIGHELHRPPVVERG